MRAEEKQGAVVLYDVCDFDLTQTFTCGQCFRWIPENEGYIGIASGRALYAEQHGDKIILYDTTMREYETFWRGYFHLDENYDAVKRILSEDAALAEAIAYGGGIRILRQDLWECMVSFIISANNNIPRIQKIIALLCRNFGEPIGYRGKTYYTFPSPECLCTLTRDELSVIRAGFRDRYILDAAQKAAAGDISLDTLSDMDTETARQQLTSVCGIGNKVADCILLFGLGRYEVFPIDVWMRRIMENLYFGKETAVDEIMSFARRQFGLLAGYAQQYLFYYAREKETKI